MKLLAENALVKEMTPPLSLGWAGFDYSDFNWTGTHNHLVCQRTLNRLAKLAK